jgi:hypothetical protein
MGRKHEMELTIQAIRNAGYEIPQSGFGSRSLVRAWGRGTFQEEYATYQEKRGPQEKGTNDGDQAINGKVLVDEQQTKKETLFDQPIPDSLKNSVSVQKLLDHYNNNS